MQKGDILAEINAPALMRNMPRRRRISPQNKPKYALADLTAKRWSRCAKPCGSEQSISVEANAKAEAARVKAAEQNVKNFEALIQFKPSSPL